MRDSHLRRRLLLEQLESRVVLSGAFDPLGDLTVDEDAGDSVVDLAAAFNDPDSGLGDGLTYMATVSPSIDGLVAQVSQANYTTLHRDLLYTHAGDNRGVTGPEHDLARDNISAYFDGLGLQTSLEAFVYNAQTYYNVVGVHPGVTRPGDVYLVGAHFDSVNNPGADDNASGTAAVMELARVLSQCSFDATLVFVAFDREEQGLLGSEAYVNAHATDRILGMLSLDMIAYNISGDGYDAVRLYDSVTGGVIKSQLAAAFAEYGGGLATVDSGHETGSDHDWFEQKGFDAALVIEHDVWSNPYYHRAEDAVESTNYIDYAYATKVTRGVLGYLATAAGVRTTSGLLAATVVGGDLILDYASDAHGFADICVRATDAQDQYAEDTFRVTVRPVNDPPTAGADEYSAAEDETLHVAARGVLWNDADVDGDALHAVLITPTAHGVLQLRSDGSFTYTPNAKFDREDVFTYIASDGVDESQPVTVQIIVQSAYPWYNGLEPRDVTDDGLVTPIDALRIINALNRGEGGALPIDRPRPLQMPFYDVNRDGYLTPIDALQVINYLNQDHGEGEAGGTDVSADVGMTRWPLAAATKLRIRAAATSAEQRGGGSRAYDAHTPTTVLQSLDLLFAALDETHHRAWGPAIARSESDADSLEEFLEALQLAGYPRRPKNLFLPAPCR